MDRVEDAYGFGLTPDSFQAPLHPRIGECAEVLLCGEHHSNGGVGLLEEGRVVRFPM